MNSNEKRQHSPHAKSKDTVLVQFTAELLSPDSPEFQERANRPRSTPTPTRSERVKPDDTATPPAG